MRLLSVLALAALLMIGGPMSDADAQSKPKVLLKTSMGDITIEVEPASAPKTVANFLAYVRDGHYDGTIFHRVISNFMIQGGGFAKDYSQKPTKAPVANEADRALKNERGTVAMARTSDPNSATAQFFINLKANGFLDHTNKTAQGWGYTAFGRVTDGMNIVARIGLVPTGSQGPFSQDAPQTQVVIEKATIISE